MEDIIYSLIKKTARSVTIHINRDGSDNEQPDWVKIVDRRIAK